MKGDRISSCCATIFTTRLFMSFFIFYFFENKRARSIVCLVARRMCVYQITVLVDSTRDEAVER